MALHVKSLNQCERNFQLFSLNSSKKYQHMLQIYNRTSTSQVRILTARKRERQYVLTFSTVLQLYICEDVEKSFTYINKEYQHNYCTSMSQNLVRMKYLNASYELQVDNCCTLFAFDPANWKPVSQDPEIVLGGHGNFFAYNNNNYYYYYYYYYCCCSSSCCNSLLLFWFRFCSLFVIL
jgi:hypothetical protein